MTGDRTGRSPNDKYLEDTPDIHPKIWWQVNRPVTTAQFDAAYDIACVSSTPSRGCTC